MIHRLLFEPAIGVARMHDDDFRGIVLSQAGDDRFGDRPRCEILAFCVDEPLRAGDLVEIKLLDLGDLFPVTVGSARTCHADLDIFELGGQRIGPGAAGGIGNFG